MGTSDTRDDRADDWGTLDPAWAGIREEFLQLAGGPVRVLRADAEAGVGPDAEPQLLVHGLGGSASNWVDVMGGLRRYGPVVALDLAGFGHTPAASGEITLRGHRALVLAVADALGWDSFALHGNSMGGLVATLIAARHPERVSRLVLVSPAFPPAHAVQMLPVPLATVHGLLPMTSRRHRVRGLMRLIFTEPDQIRPALLDVMAADSRPRDDQEAIDHKRALRESTRSIAATWVDARGLYRAIDAVQAPTLLLGGTADALVPARVLRKVLARRTDWSGAVLDDHRHALMLDRPQEFLDRVAAWHDASEPAVA